MDESHTEIAPGEWSVPQCPFKVEYVPRVLDDIRLAVMDAFFSLPRGGAEIGGILLGRHTEGRVTIAECAPLECEHANGPSFTLSANDEAKLHELLEQSRSNPAGLVPVGWYHSHTRSEIFLSDADQDLHKRFFPEPWQVALVFKPHTFQPMRGGFFFREPDGSIHATASYQEFQLEAMPLRPLPTGVVPPMLAHTSPLLHREAESGGPVLDIGAAAAAAPESGAVVQSGAALAAATEVAEPEPPPPPASFPEPPKFATAEPAQRSWLWLKAVLALAAGLAVGAFGFQTRQTWRPWFSGAPRPTASTAASDLSLSTADLNGQLQIRWDPKSRPVQRGTSALLTVTDGDALPQQIQMDQAHLRSGLMTFARQGSHVDIAMAVNQPNGEDSIRAITGFVGKPPEKAAPPADDSAKKAADAKIAKLTADLAAQTDHIHQIENLLAQQSALVHDAAKMKDDLAAEVEKNKKLQAQVADVAKLRKDLAAANDRNQKLTRNLADAQNELKQQQRKRIAAQDPGK